VLAMLCTGSKGWDRRDFIGVNWTEWSNLGDRGNGTTLFWMVGWDERMVYPLANVIAQVAGDFRLDDDWLTLEKDDNVDDGDDLTLPMTVGVGECRECRECGWFMGLSSV